MKTRIQILCAALLCMGCSKEVPVTREVGTKSAPVADLERRLVSDGGIRFTSWKGERRGMDSDFRIVLRKGRALALEVDGIGPKVYQGTFTLGPDGRIVASIPSYQAGWPVMMVRQESGVLKLYCEDGVTSLFPDSPQADGFWPFVAN